MPVQLGTNNDGDTGWTGVRRRVFITDKDGVEYEATQEALDRILAQMTPEERKDFEARYRFAPVQNLTKNINYTGTIRDL